MTASHLSHYLLIDYNPDLISAQDINMALQAASLPEYVQKGLQGTNEQPVLAFPKKIDGFSDFARYTTADLRQLTKDASSWYFSNGLKPRQKGDRALTVSVVARGNIDWVATFYAVASMGHCFSVISPRLSDATVAALVNKAEADLVIHQDREAVADAVSMKLIPIFQTANPQQCPSIPAEQLWCDLAAVGPRDLGWIAHSSGSTGIPKLFRTTQEAIGRELPVMHQLCVPDKSNWVSSAPYNVLGLRMAAVCLTKHDGGVTYFDNDHTPFTSDGLVEFLSDAKPVNLWVTPYALELLATSEAGTTILQRAENITMFGSVLQKTIGDKLADLDIHIGSAYGMSEAGPLMTSSLRPRGDKDWDYLMPSSDNHAKSLEFRPVDMTLQTAESDEQLYEAVVLPNWPPVLEDVKAADGCYYTGDLFQKHPTKDNRWRVVGRKDDQIKCYQSDRQCLINGFEYENKIKAGNEDVLEEAVMFGQGKDKIGVLIFAENAVGPARQWVLERVWKTIKNEINNKLKVPIEKDMIKIITGDAELPRTSKLNIIRPQVMMKYRQVIASAYPEEKIANVPLHATLHPVKSRG